MPRSRGSEMPQRQSPRAPSQLRTSSSESDPIHHRPVTDRSPKLGDRRSPRGAQSDPLNQRKLGTRIADLESQLGQAQDELKSLKGQLASAEAAKKAAQEQLEKKTKKPTVADSDQIQETNNDNRINLTHEIHEDDEMKEADVFEVPVEKLTPPNVEISHPFAEDDLKSSSLSPDESVKPSFEELNLKDEEISSLKSKLEEKEKELEVFSQENENLKKELNEKMHREFTARKVKKRVRLMNADTANGATTSTEGVNTNEVEVESNTVDSLEVLSSSGGNVMHEVGRIGEILTRLELDLACISEKLVNLDLFVMHVETRESDFEAFASEKEGTSNDIVEKAIEFDLLSGVLDSEVTELSGLLSSVATEIDNVRKVISSRGYADEAFILIEEKLYDSEKSLKQLQDHLLELRAQCTNFHGIMLTSQGDRDWQDGEAADYFNSDALLTPKTKIKMQTVEQQRHILRMLEKSLARELDLEKKLTESRQVEEELEVRLQQEAFCMEEEIEDASQRLFEGENAAEVLLGISKSLLGRLQMTHFNLNGTVQKESYLQSKLQEMEEHLKAKDNLLGKSESTSKELGDKVKSLEKRLEDSEFQLSNTTSARNSQEIESKILEMEDIINTLKEKNSEAERRIDTAETECKILKEANVELDKELNFLKSSSSITSERIIVLEKQLRNSELQLQHAVASAEASQEKQIMLNSTIKDMEDLIEDLKSKVSKAESLMESAEDKCIILSESNSDLNEELTFVRGRLACLESSLRQAEEMKKATARDINFRSKLITDLILQLALERERLEKQIALLIMENKAQKKPFQQKDKVPSPAPESDGKDTRESMLPKAELSAVTSLNKCKEEKFSSITNVEENVYGDFMSIKSKETDSSTRLDASRDIDARQLSWKYVLAAVLVFLISAVVTFLVQNQSIQL